MLFTTALSYLRLILSAGIARSNSIIEIEEEEVDEELFRVHLWGKLHAIAT